MGVLAQWVALKIMVAERNHPEIAVTPQEERSRFKDTLEVPGNYRIWIAKCGTGGWETRYVRRAATIGKSPIVTPQHRFKNIHSVAFGIGDLFVLAIYTTVDGVLNSNPIESEAVVRIFPVLGPRNWPPPRSFTVSEADAAANTFDRLFNAPNVHWVPGFPG